MDRRDLDYIESRLMSPGTDTLDAIERLRKAGEHDLADEVMHGLQEFTDVCRRQRHILMDRFNSLQATRKLLYGSDPLADELGGQ